MIDRNTPSDPRLRERRGDLIGLNAILFAIALLLAFGAVAWILLVVLPGAKAPPASATPPAAGATPTVTATPSVTPSSTPTATAPPAAPTIASVGTRAPLRVDGQPVARVTAEEPTFRRRIGDERASETERFAVVEILYQAIQAVEYRAADWVIEDAEGARHEAIDIAPSPALGEGALEAGEEVTGLVAFRVSRGVDVAAVVLRSSSGGDAIVFEVR